MKRFFFEEEDDDNEDEMMEDSGRMPEFVPEFFAMSQQENPAIHILNCSVRICEQNFFWRFFSQSKKMAMVRSVFNGLVALMGEDPEAEGKEKE